MLSFNLQQMKYVEITLHIYKFIDKKAEYAVKKNQQNLLAVKCGIKYKKKY